MGVGVRGVLRNSAWSFLSGVLGPALVGEAASSRSCEGGVPFGNLDKKPVGGVDGYSSLG